MYCYWIEKSEIQKKGPLIKMAPTLKSFGVVSRFLYSGGWQVWVSLPPVGILNSYVPFEIFIYLFTVSPISTAVLNTYDTYIKLLLLLLLLLENSPKKARALIG